MRFHIQGRSYQFKALPFSLSTAPMEFTVVAKKVKLMALQRGIRIHQYLDNWLVRATSPQTCLQHSQTLVALCRELGWLVNKEKSELDPKQVFNFVGYQFDLKEGKVRPTPEHWQSLIDKIQTILSGPAVHVPHRALNSHRKASPPRSTLYETHTVALEEQLEGTRITSKGDTCPQVAPPPLKVVAGGKQCGSRSTITPTKTCSADIYRCIKRRVGRSLKRAHCKGNLVPSRKQAAYKPLGTKGSLSGPKRVPRPLLKQHSPGGHRQHNSGCLYKQGRGDEVELSVCPAVENPVLVHKETGNSQSTTHPRPAERDSRQAIQTWQDHSKGMVPSSRVVPTYLLPVVPAPGGSVCHQIQQQTATVCVTGPTPPGMGSGCTQSVLGRSGPICLPSSSHLGQSGGEVAGLPMQQNHTDSTGLAQHALVLGSSGNVESDPTVPAQPGVSAIQPDPAQEPVKPEPTCLAPRATAIKEQGFSEAVAARIEAP